MIADKVLEAPVLPWCLYSIYTNIYKRPLKVEITEVQSQQMAFTQSLSVSNNPKIPTYYLIFAVI
jgi:hypothetical protein